MKGIWKYEDLLPPVERRISLGEGDTPLFQLSSEIFLKDESRNPTGSFEDRASAFAISWLLDRGETKVICDEDLDRCLSLATYAAKAGMECLTPIMNLSLSLLGAKYTKRGEILKERFYHIGEMTIAFEIAERIDPEVIVLPMGSGSNVSMIWEGFKIALDSGMSERLPKIIAVKPKFPKDSIARELIQKPIFKKSALKAIKESNGKLISVSEEEILRAQRSLAKMGFLLSPSGAIAYSALSEVKGRKAVLLLTGSFRGVALEVSGTKEIILHLLLETPSHGYALWKRLREYKPISVQAVYQHLRELESKMLVERDDEGIYRVTSKGKMLLVKS
jgi:threonine synthase